MFLYSIRAVGFEKYRIDCVNFALVRRNKNAVPCFVVFLIGTFEYRVCVSCCRTHSFFLFNY
jgi:hypothetical protein